MAMRKHGTFIFVVVFIPPSTKMGKRAPQVGPMVGTSLGRGPHAAAVVEPLGNWLCLTSTNKLSQMTSVLPVRPFKQQPDSSTSQNSRNPSTYPPINPIPRFSRTLETRTGCFGTFRIELLLSCDSKLMWLPGRKTKQLV